MGQDSSLCVFGPEVRAEHGRFECYGNHYSGGHNTEINGIAVVPLGINNPSGGPEANQYSFDLVYDTWSTDEHEANGPGGSFFCIFALGKSLFGGPKLGSKTIDLIKTNPSEKTWSVTDNCKALSFK